MNINRVVLLVLDGVGIGALPDAGEYGDEGAHTLLHCAQAVDGLSLRTLDRLGLGHVVSYPGASFSRAPLAHYGRLAEASAGKDTLTGHWEMMGLILREPFPTFPGGIPETILDQLAAETGYRPLGGCPASGTSILESLGEEHLRTRRPILYTSADSVLQIAAHLDLYSLEELYALCEKARRLTESWRIARVIARPFIGQPGSFRRTPDRRDFSLPPPSGTLLDRLQQSGVPVVAIGKIDDIFAGRGISVRRSAHTNAEVTRCVRSALEDLQHGLIFANLNDFDTLYGHRRDPAGFAAALRELDASLPGLLAWLRSEDLLLLTSDHGCDPTFRGTDHTREFAPLMAYCSARSPGSWLGVGSTFSDLAATIAHAFSVPWNGPGVSFFSRLEAC
ncbi:MAG: phosphopentomutase [bacterium]